MKHLGVVLVTLMFGSSLSLSSEDTLRAVRGVWLTNVDSEVLNSDTNIRQAVDHCASIGINTIFVVTWNKGMTTYPSAIMKKMTGREIDTLFRGRDPLAELIAAAHARDIKVIAWFEFGFSSSFRDRGGDLIRRNPDWAARTASGRLVSKNGFEWMNGFYPPVQNFLMSLIMEVVTSYDIDGIQGDDRLPAMPSESGYDNYSVQLYRSQHDGRNPPKNHKDPGWVEWRVGILNTFMERLYTTVKAAKPNVIVSMAPSLYPWSKEEYLQDWPTWVRNHHVDLIIPQDYRYDLKSYARQLDTIITTQIEKDHLFKFYPGILLKVGDYTPSRKLLAGMIRENRKRGIQGEVFFFYEGLKLHSEFMSRLYERKAAFPVLVP